MSTFVVQGDAVRLPFKDGAFSLVFGSPPYLSQRSYDDGSLPAGHVVARDCVSWVEWMLAVTTEACRVSRGLVLWVVAGSTEDRCYQPGPEGLVWEWYKRGNQLWRPCYWHRNTIPGGGGDHWLRGDVEYVLCFKSTREWPEWSDNTACGHPPKWAPGGEMSHRLADGKRVNQWGGRKKSGRSRKRNGTQQPPGRPSHQFPEDLAAPEGVDLFGNPIVPEVRPAGDAFGMTGQVAHGPRGKIIKVTRPHTKRKSNGTHEDQSYRPPALANPGTLLVSAPEGEQAPWGYTVHTNVGGGQMGDQRAHLSEAPFPEDLVRFFLLGWCPPGGWILDPFGGSGTTAAVAVKLGRNAVTLDLRPSQCSVALQRLDGVQKELFV